MDFFPLLASSLDMMVYIRLESGGSYFSFGIPRPLCVHKIHKNDYTHIIMSLLFRPRPKHKFIIREMFLLLNVLLGKVIHYNYGVRQT